MHLSFKTLPIELKDFPSKMEKTFQYMEKLILTAESDQNKKINLFLKKIEKLFISPKDYPSVTMLELNGQIQSLQNKIEFYEKQTEINTEKSTLSHVIEKDQQINKLNMEIIELNSKCNQLQNQLKTIKGTVCNLNNAANQKQILVNSNTDEIMNAAEIGKLQTDTDVMKFELSNEIEKLSNSLNDEIKQNEMLQTELSETKNLLARYCNEKIDDSGDGYNIPLAAGKSTILLDIMALKSTIKELQDKKQNAEVEIIRLKEIETKYDEYGQEVVRLQTWNHELQTKLNGKEKLVNRKKLTIKEMENKLLQLKQTTMDESKLLELKKRDLENQETIKKLKNELTKRQQAIDHQDQTINTHQKLLHIRSEVINSLQDKEDYVQRQLHQTNMEIAAKAEELQNLFSTLGAKDLELIRQKEIIAELAESNKRSKGKQREIEAKMEDLCTENIQLKRQFGLISRQYVIR